MCKPRILILNIQACFFDTSVALTYISVSRGSKDQSEFWPEETNISDHTHWKNNFGLLLMPNTDSYRNLIVMGIALNYDNFGKYLKADGKITLWKKSINQIKNPCWLKAHFTFYRLLMKVHLLQLFKGKVDFLITMRAPL